MKKGRSTKAPTKEESARFNAIKEIGCVVGWILGHGTIPCEIHHLTAGGKHGQKRRGHEFTVGLSQWSHRGIIPPDCADKVEAERKYGPSYALTPRKFREQFSDEMLMEVQEKLLSLYKEQNYGNSLY